MSIRRRMKIDKTQEKKKQERKRGEFLINKRTKSKLSKRLH